LKEAENFVTQPFAGEILILPFQQGRFGGYFLASALQSGTKPGILYMGFLGASSELEYTGCPL